jgi:hypothetical protein
MQLTQGTIRILRDCGGKGTMGCLFTMILAGAAVLTAVQAGPPYIAYSNLKGDIATEVSRAGSHFFTDEILVQNILETAKKDEVNLTRENITVERSARNLDVIIDYSVPVNFVFVQHTFYFEIRASSFVGSL